MDVHSQDVPPTSEGGYFVRYGGVRQPNSNEVSLSEIWRLLKAARLQVIIVTVLCTVIAVAISFLITPVYKAEVLLLPVIDEWTGGASSVLSSQLNGLASLAGLSAGNNGTGRDEAIATLQSRVLIDLYVKENALLPVLFANDWDANAGRWKSINHDDIPTLWDAYKLIEKRVRQVKVDKKTGLVTLIIEWKDPEIAARWAQGMVNRANTYLRTKAVKNAENNLTYLQEQARQATSVELQQTIYRFMEIEVKKAMLANASEEYAFKIIDPPVVPEEVESPKRLRIAAVGVLAGLFMAIIVALSKRGNPGKERVT